MRHTAPFVIAGLALVASPAVAQDTVHRVVLRDTVRTSRLGAYQGRNTGPEQTERSSRKVKIGRDGRFSLAHVAGNIVVTGGPGDEVSIEAVKRTRGARARNASKNRKTPVAALKAKTIVMLISLSTGLIQISRCVLLRLRRAGWRRPVFCGRVI